MGRVGLNNGWERRLRLAGEGCSEEETVDGRSLANLQIARVCGSMCGREQVKDT